MVRINLLPPEYRPQPQIKPVRLLILLFMILTPIFLAGFVVYGYFQIQALKNEIAQIQRERAELGPLYDEVLSMERALQIVQEKLAAMERITANHLRPLEFFAALNSMTPDSVALNNVSLGPGGRVTLSGEAVDYYGVAAFQLKLIVSDSFKNTILSDASGPDTVRFQMTSVFSPIPSGSSAQVPGAAVVIGQQGAGRPPASTRPSQVPVGSDDGSGSDQGGLQ